MAPKLDPFLIQHGGLSFDPRQASVIQARIGSMPRGEQGPCRAFGSFALDQDAAHERDAAPNRFVPTVDPEQDYGLRPNPLMPSPPSNSPALEPPSRLNRP